MTKSPPAVVNAPAPAECGFVSPLSEIEGQARESRLTIGGVAHDLRNLLCVISAQAELVLESVAGPDSVRDDLRRIVRASARATQLASQLVSRAYESTTEPAALALDVSIEAACDLSRALLGSEFELLTFLRTSASVCIDPSSFERILINLVLNARDAMPAGGPIVIEASALQLPAGPESERLQLAPGAYVVLQVQDRGSGLTRDTREQLFRPFFTTKEPGKGSGLGLAVVAELVQRHGGAVDVQSEPALGT
ncbi:MAG TPA: ATP-binding protein, partial [Polyangiaceae bacterium]|nr:ATP-binding protein [Polyangiaceae bacterium]